MGIYDRDYYRQEQPGPSLRGPRTMVGTLILINVVLYVADWLLTSETHRITLTLAASDDTLTNPLLWWQFLTYGFVHDPKPYHILLNMLQLWFLGREVEELYGRSEFLRVYLVMLVIGSVIWAVAGALFNPLHALPNGGPSRPFHYLLGASGAISGVVMLFILNFPQRTLVLFPIPIPIKAWVLGVVLVAMNLFGALGQVGNTAFGVHLSGIAFAYLYFRNRWNLRWLRTGPFSGAWFKRRPTLRVHNPDREARRDPELGEEVDRILAKIHREGETSLTRKERRTLETASRQYQRKRRGPGDEDV